MLAKTGIISESDAEKIVKGLTSILDDIEKGTFEFKMCIRDSPIIVPRAVVVVEAMAALTAADMLLLSMTSRLDRVQAFFARDRV